MNKHAPPTAETGTQLAPEAKPVRVMPARPPRRSRPAATGPADYDQRFGWLRRLPARALYYLQHGWDALTFRWRRSLQFRTVIITVVLVALAFAGVGAFLSNQIATGLFKERLHQAQQESRRGLSQVKSILENADGRDQVTTSTLVNDTLPILVGTGADTPRCFLLVPMPDRATQNLWVASRNSCNITATVIPDELRNAIQHNSGQYWRSIALPVGESDVPAIAFGTSLTLPPGNEYELYLIYDLSSAQETLNYIHGALWVGGLILLVLVGGIVLLVTRSVMLPVSHAAMVSEKLAAGHLQERMVVKGEDETARLGASFNHMAASLQEQINKLAELSQMQHRFVSDVSHELRTPLTTVRMAAEVLYEARRNFDPINKRSAELLYNQVERFQSLLADLLEISRFDAGAAVLDAEPTNIFDVIHHVIEGTQPLADNNGSTVEIVSDLSRCVADMDPRRIDRILRNLLDNALEHGAGKPVQIYVASTADAIAVAVRDHGIGMSEVDAERVFDRFWRADPARARTTGGSGLGLSIATEDAQLHGGWLQAWGRADEGSCFRLTLPRRRGAALLESPLALPPGPVLDPGTDSTLGETAPDETPPPTGHGHGHGHGQKVDHDLES